ncbi:glycosyltransferase family 1 protein [Brevundimonas sp.]|uniref:glycosyltransferase family 4 protein n=1 Tax=Brevundimonas sp. TaxID=1871086 RepID=UPI00289BEE62|nr:glycosyltransferase family 1 protein [Brevundimonas sp.]
MTQDILFDASRLLSRTDRSAPTGVDRVCLAYAEWLVDHPDYRMVPVRSRHDQLAAVDSRWFRECMTELRQRWTGDASHRALNANERRLFAALEAAQPTTSVIGQAPAPDEPRPGKKTRVWKQYFRSRRVAAPPPAQLYFNVGHTSLNTPEILTSLGARGIDRVVMLHDLIPITHPEFCRPGDGAKHRRRVLTALRHASRIVVNSQYTADELLAFADREKMPSPPIDVAHLGLEPIFQRGQPTAARRPYFVHVGTIEARKNLAFLLTIWRRLHEKMGDQAPRLVLIGRYGWENEAVLDHLQRSPNLQGLVHQVENLPDTALADLMNGAQAVLAPSSVEGFDLPAVEASALGVPLIASDIPAHREMVPQATLIDPLDGLGWMAALEAATRLRPVAPAYSAPTWKSHFQSIEDHLLPPLAATAAAG